MISTKLSLALTLLLALQFSNVKAECRKDTINYYSYYPNSSKTYLTSRTINTHDANNLIINRLDQNRDTINSTWINSYKYAYSYDVKKNQTYELGQQWDAISENWINSYQANYTYDVNGNLIEQLGKDWVIANNEWVNNNKITHTFDGANNRTQYIEMKWNITTSSWSNKAKNDYTYNATKKITSQTTHSWDITNNVWKPNSKTTNTYNSFNETTSILTQNWDNTNNVWLNQRQYLYTYPNIGLTKILTQKWMVSIWVNETQETQKLLPNKKIEEQLIENFIGMNWIPVRRYTKTYDANANLLTDIHEVYNLGSSNWLYAAKYSYSYNAQNKTLTYQHQTWNASNSSWLNFSEILYEYDVNVNLVAIVQLGNWDKTKAFYTFKQREEYICAIITNSLKIQKQDTEITLYPNPAKNSFQIKTTEKIFSVQIFNPEGKMILESSASIINLHDFKNGIYFVKISHAKGIHFGKLTIDN